MRETLGSLLRRIAWFESKRRAPDDGFYYCDIINHLWESGVDEDIRFIGVATGPQACVDATAHVVFLYDCAVRWSAAVGGEPELWIRQTVRIARLHPHGGNPEVLQRKLHTAYNTLCREYVGNTVLCPGPPLTGERG